MNPEILNKIDRLKQALESDKRLVTLDEIEKRMENNAEVMRLAYQKDVSESVYNDALRHFSETSHEVKVAQQKLFEAKTALDKHPLIREYLAAYREVRILFEEINETLFSPFKEHLCRGNNK